MRKASTITIPAALGLVLTALSCWTGAAIGTGNGYTLRAAYMLNKHCEDGLLRSLSLAGALMEAEARHALDLDCRTATHLATTNFPSYGYGWAVLALFSATQAEWTAMNLALANSQALAPGTQWIGQLRLTIGQRFTERLDPAGRAAMASDVDMLLNSTRGRNRLAELYAADSSARQGIETALEAQSGSVQAAFLSTLRAAVGPAP
jgi:hypothetical protein